MLQNGLELLLNGSSLVLLLQELGLLCAIWSSDVFLRAIQTVFAIGWIERTMGLKGGTGLMLYLSGRVVLSVLGRLSHLIKKTE